MIKSGWTLYMHSTWYAVAQLLSRVRLSAAPWTAARQASLSITISWSLLKPMSTELVMPSNHLILCHLLLLLPSIFPSIRVYSSESTLRIRWPKYVTYIQSMIRMWSLWHRSVSGTDSQSTAYSQYAFWIKSQDGNKCLKSLEVLIESEIVLFSRKQFLLNTSICSLPLLPSNNDLFVHLLKYSYVWVIIAITYFNCHLLLMWTQA